MKNNKGFTFVELLSVIVVLGIIVLIATPVYNSVRSRLEKRNYENKIKLIEVAAAKYSEDTNIEVMYVDDLVKDGYLEADNENGHILNPLNQKETLNCHMVKSTLEGNLYYAKFQDKEYREENGCSLNALNEVNQTFQIKMYEGKISKSSIFNGNTTNNSYWTKNDVVLEAVLNNKDYEDKIKKIEWYIGYNQTPDKEQTTMYYNVTTDSVLQQNYTAKLYVDDEGKEKIFTATVRVYIDKINPSFYENDAIGLDDIWEREKIYKIASYDNESNIYGYQLKNADESCPTSINDYKKSNKFKITKNGKYKACIIDNVGNRNEKEITINHVDRIPPRCEWGGEMTTWTKENRTITLVGKDDESGSTSKYSWSYTKGTTKTASLEYTISDLAGNTTKCKKTANVYVDKDAPSKPTVGSIGSVNGSNVIGSIQNKASGSNDGIGSGVKEYRYLITNTPNIPANKNSFTTNITFTRSCGTSYYAWVVAVDHVGNISDIVSLGSTSDGINSYSSFTSCSKSCGGGTQTRTNSCALITTGLSQSCNPQSCCSSVETIYSYGPWSSYSCDVSEGHSKRYRSVTTSTVSSYDHNIVCGTNNSTSQDFEYLPGGFGDDGCFKAGGNARGVKTKKIARQFSCTFGHHYTASSKDYNYVYYIYDVDGSGRVSPTPRAHSPQYACPNPSCAHQGYCTEKSCDQGSTYWWIYRAG